MKNQSIDNRNTIRFIILLLTVLLSPVLLQYTKLSIFKVLDDVVFMLLCIDTILCRKNADYNIKPADERYYVNVVSVLLALFLSYLVFSTFLGYINGNSVDVILLQVRQYKFFLLFILMWLYDSEDLYFSSLKIYRVMIYLSIPVSFLQRFLIDDRSGDVVTGLFGYGASGTMTLLILIVFFSELTFRLYNNKKPIGLYIIALIPIALNETKIAFVLIPILFVVSLFLSKKLNLNSFIAVSLILAILLPVGNYFYKMFYNTDAWELFVDPEKFELYFSSDEAEDVGRFRKIELSYEIIQENHFTNFFGYGTGASFVSTAESKKTGVIAGSNYITPKLFTGTRPQLYMNIIDMGVVGIILMYLFFLAAFIKAFKKKRYKIYDITLMFSIIIVFVGMIYQHILFTPVIMFLLLYSLFMSNKYNIDKRNGDNENDILAEYQQI